MGLDQGLGFRGLELDLNPLVSCKVTDEMENLCIGPCTWVVLKNKAPSWFQIILRQLILEYHKGTLILGTPHLLFATLLGGAADNMADSLNFS